MRFAVAIVSFLVIRFVFSETPPASCKQCQTPGNLDEIDWHRMAEGTWYDVMNIPLSGPAADCFNWRKFDVNGSGFMVTLDAMSRRRVEVDAVKFLFTNTGSGVYKLEHAYKQETIDAVKKHLVTEEEKAIVEEHYENYFFAGYCTKDGWVMNVKSPRHVIDADDIVRMSNVLNKHGISGEMDLKKICFELNKANIPDRRITSMLYLISLTFVAAWTTI